MPMIPIPPESEWPEHIKEFHARWDRLAVHFKEMADKQTGIDFFSQGRKSAFLAAIDSMEADYPTQAELDADFATYIESCNQLENR